MIAAIDRLYRCVMLAFGRGRVTFVDDAGPVQEIQARFGAREVIDNMPAPHDFGFTSNPPIGSDVVASFLGGSRKNGVVVAIGSQAYRLKNLKSGEVAIYDDLGQSVYLTRTGIVINGAGLPVKITNTPSITLDAAAVHVTGNLSVDGVVTAPTVVGTTNVTFGGKSGITHTHSGVQTGSGTTGAPV
jgi:phage baseplate assembly protein V